MCSSDLALGVSWDLTCDHFRFLAPGGIVLSPDPITKRSLLSLALKMFDPLGLISPLTVKNPLPRTVVERIRYCGMTLWTVKLKQSGYIGSQSCCN